MTDKTVSQDAPLKLLVNDLKTVAVSQSQRYPWKIKFAPDNLNSSVAVEFSQVWVQGSVKSCSDDGDLITINDGSGDIRVTKCSRTPGDRSWLSSGSYCGVLAKVKQPSKSIPEVEAIKLMHIIDTRNEAKLMWPLEVQELSNFLRGNITFNV